MVLPLKKMQISEIIYPDPPLCTMLYVLRVVSRLQGDSLSESRSEEEHRPHISEQAVPNISCMLHNTVQMMQTYVCIYCSVFSCFVVSNPSVLLFVPLVGLVWFISSARAGHITRTIAGM